MVASAYVPQPKSFHRRKVHDAAARVATSSTSMFSEARLFIAASLVQPYTSAVILIERMPERPRDFFKRGTSLVSEDSTPKPTGVTDEDSLKPDKPSVVVSA